MFKSAGVYEVFSDPIKKDPLLINTGHGQPLEGGRSGFGGGGMNMDDIFLVSLADIFGWRFVAVGAALVVSPGFSGGGGGSRRVKGSNLKNKA